MVRRSFTLTAISHAGTSLSTPIVLAALSVWADRRECRVSPLVYAVRVCGCSGDYVCSEAYSYCIQCTGYGVYTCECTNDYSYCFDTYGPDSDDSAGGGGGGGGGLSAGAIVGIVVGVVALIFLLLAVLRLCTRSSSSTFSSAASNSGKIGQPAAAIQVVASPTMPAMQMASYPPPMMHPANVYGAAYPQPYQQQQQQQQQQQGYPPQMQMQPGYAYPQPQ